MATGEGRQAKGKKKDMAVECSSGKGKMLGVGSLSLLTLLSQADVTWSLTNLVMRHENAPWWQLNHLSSVRCPRPNISVCCPLLSADA